MEIIGYTIGFFSCVITILTGILTYQTWKNGKWMKLAHETTQNLIRRLHEDTQNLMRKLHEDTQNLIMQMRKETVEILKEIAKLIVTEGEKTRKAIEKQ